MAEAAVGSLMPKTNLPRPPGDIGISPAWPFAARREVAAPAIVDRAVSAARGEI